MRALILVCSVAILVTVPGSGGLIGFGGSEAHGAAQEPPGRIIHVNVESLAAADGNPGTETIPLKTIGRAAQIAVADNATGTPVAVLIHPGTYREAVSLPPGGTDARMTFQATQAGKVVISGSDVWKGWIRSGDRGIYTHPWPYTWGLAPLPSGWPTIEDIVRRREMVFVNGALLTQVLRPDQVLPGTYFVDEAAHLVYVRPGGGIDLVTATVEVSVRDLLFKAEGRANLTIRGLVFEHAATAPDASAVWVDGMRGFRIEDSVLRWNNWDGLGITNSVNAIVRRSAGIHNGARGMSNWKNKNLQYEDTETSYNNWRGGRGGFYGWAAAGIKNLRLHHGVFRRHKSVGNAAYGFWLDTDNQDIIIEGGFWCGNIHGAFVEASQGPTLIARTVICGNKSSGLVASISNHVTVRDSILYDNGMDAQFATNNLTSGTVVDWETGRTITLRTEDWTFCGDAFVATKPGQYLLAIPPWSFFRNTLRSAKNVYWNPLHPDVFWLPRSLVGGRAMDLPAWQHASRQDAGSVFADPRFADAAHWNFAPLPSSPWRTCR